MSNTRSERSDDATRYVCVECKREGTMAEWQERSIEECRPGWTHGRLIRIETSADEALRLDHIRQARGQLRHATENFEAAGWRGSVINLLRMIDGQATDLLGEGRDEPS